MPRFNRQAQYLPAILPKDIERPGFLVSLMVSLQEEFDNIRRAFNRQHNYSVFTSPPDKIVEGMVRYADGINWDPGKGKGLYVYTGVEWEKLHG